MVTTCYYDTTVSMKRYCNFSSFSIYLFFIFIQGYENATMGGFSIQDEMCVNYIHYYPATELEVKILNFFIKDRPWKMGQLLQFFNDESSLINAINNFNLIV